MQVRTPPSTQTETTGLERQVPGIKRTATPHRLAATRCTFSSRNERGSRKVTAVGIGKGLLALTYTPEFQPPTHPRWVHGPRSGTLFGRTVWKHSKAFAGRRRLSGGHRSRKPRVRKRQWFSSPSSASQWPYEELPRRSMVHYSLPEELPLCLRPFHVDLCCLASRPYR